MSDPRSVLVTGCSSGIGRATCLLLDRSGFRVFAGVRRREDAEALQAEASERLEPVMLDVTEAEAIRRAAARVTEVCGETGLHGLVNNAGTPASAPVEFLSAGALRYPFEVNLFGPILLTQALIPSLRAARGRVLNVTSGSTAMGPPFMTPYVGSKAALEVHTESLRREIEPQGVSVVLLDPGHVRTPLSDTTSQPASESAPPAELIERYGAKFSELLEGAEYLNRNYGKPPEAVARVILQAMQASRPKDFYKVGREAHFVRLAQRLLPARARHALIKRVLKV